MTDHSLSTRARIFKSHVVEGQTFAEIADAEGMTRSAVSSIIKRWRVKIVEARGVAAAMGWAVK